MKKSAQNPQAAPRTAHHRICGSDSRISEERPRHGGCHDGGDDDRSEDLGRKISEEDFEGKEYPAHRGVEYGGDPARRPAPDQAAHPFARDPEELSDRRPGRRSDLRDGRFPPDGTTGSERHGGGDRPQGHRAGADDPPVEGHRLHRGRYAIPLGFLGELVDEGTDGQASEGRDQEDQPGSGCHGGIEHAEKEMGEEADAQQERHGAQTGEPADHRGKQDEEGLIPDPQALRGPVDPLTPQVQRRENRGLHPLDHYPGVFARIGRKGPESAAPNSPSNLIFRRNICIVTAYSTTMF